ncbi:hypothetical protein SZN_30894 [Streptomyces zinciresistens K42]|uniref:Cysteine dioxygenase n=1 Tax=Streptomyces zinciresistens K42 TaxID=700597 RepID=G2GKY5_9ACTN|nr:hypothetical protein [Streptomyces zinciresistens]EGX55835.1 hypothetical protein SZN_30894 [Streptomyces zinciresistens K42]
MEDECRGGRQVLAARGLLTGSLDGELAEHELTEAARRVVTELGVPGRLVELLDELAAGEGDPHGCARLSYRHVLGFDKLLLIDGGPRHMLRVHVWRPGAGAIGREDIHNHRSPLASYVVRGRLAMELYEVAADGPGGLAAARYEEALAERTASWTLRPAGPARLRLTHAGRYAAGSSYALPAHTLHRAWCDTDEPAVTLFLETGARRRRHTDVFTAAGPHPGAVAKVPLAVPEYLGALRGLAERLRAW